MKSSFDRITTSILVVVLLVLVGLRVQEYRESKHPPETSSGLGDFKYHADWTGFREIGLQSRDSTSPIQIVEVVDFECPFCKQFNSAFVNVEAKYPGLINRIYVPFPLPGHRFAYFAGRMAECANAQGKFWAMHDLLFAKQDSFGIKSWSSYGHDVGVSNEAKFNSCIAKSDPVARLDRWQKVEATYKIGGTPTVYINGCRMMTTPTEDLMISIIDKLLAGKSPEAYGLTCKIPRRT